MVDECVRASEFRSPWPSGILTGRALCCMFWVRHRSWPGLYSVDPMKACLLQAPAKIETNPLVFVNVPAPQPAKGEVLVRASYCGVCRTDLHVIEGELTPRKSPVIPGHQVIGVVEKLGADVRKLRVGSR